MLCFSCILFEMQNRDSKGKGPAGMNHTFPKLNCGGPTWNALFRCIKHTSILDIVSWSFNPEHVLPPKKTTRQLRLGVTRRWEGPSKNNQSIFWWVHEKNFSLRIPFRFSNKYRVGSKGEGNRLAGSCVAKCRGNHVPTLWASRKLSHSTGSGADVTRGQFRYHWCSWINVLMPPKGW